LNFFPKHKKQIDFNAELWYIKIYICKNGGTEMEYENNGSAKPEKEHGKVYKWFENFWYYYKFRVLAVLVVGVLVTYLVVQCATSKEIDLCIYYLGEDPLVYSEQSKALIDAVSEFVGDFDGDGEVRVEMKTYFVGESYDKTAYETQLEEFNTAFTGGTVMFIITDDAGVRYLRNKADGGWLNSVSDIVGEDASYDGYAYKLTGTDLFTESDLEDVWEGEDLYMGLRVFNDKSIIHVINGVDEKYEFAEGVFKNIYEYNK